jgi:AcrR family transcriptional regulator
MEMHSCLSLRWSIVLVVDDALTEPARRQRAVERSTRAAEQRAEQRVQGFLDSAQQLLAERGTTDFTVQEVVDRSKQSLRSFYQHFDGKHELLLALYEDALSASAVEIREAVARETDPLGRLRLAVRWLYDRSRHDPARRRPLFSDFALQLMIKHPAQVATAQLPLLAVFTELVERAAEAGAIPAGRPRRRASLVMQTAMFTAQSPTVPVGGHAAPVTAEEIWEFCLGGVMATWPALQGPDTGG